MITVAHIYKQNNVHYFYSIVNNKITIQTYEGPDGFMKEQLVRLKASSFLILFEDFLNCDKQIVDRGKDVHAYQEMIERIKAYMKWGHENYDVAPGSVVDNGFISVKYMKSMIKMISNEHPMKKELIFIAFTITKTYHAPYNI